MNSKQRENKRRDDLIIKLHGYGCTIKEIVKESKKSELHVNNVINLFKARGW